MEARFARQLCLESAIRIREYQHRAFGYLNPAISGGRNSCVRLSDECQRIRTFPAPKRFRGCFVAAIVHDDDFKAWPIVCCAREARQLSSGTQSLYVPMITLNSGEADEIGSSVTIGSNVAKDIATAT